jgi:crotonobetainyl-CoA:carnitine CoA-transferase CaiB-like acyl-CoA transferase
MLRRQRRAPRAPIRAALAAPETAARDMVETGDHPSAGPGRRVASPLKLGRTPVAAPTAPPLLGQDSRAVLAGMGYDEAAIDALAAAGIIA